MSIDMKKTLEQIRIHTQEKEMKRRMLRDERKRKMPKIRKSQLAFLALGGGIFLLVPESVTAFASSDPIQVVNNLSNFVFSLIRAVGMILLGLGIVQVGLSLKSHDPSQRANGFMTLAGGVVITFAKEILNLIVG